MDLEEGEVSDSEPFDEGPSNASIQTTDADGGGRGRRGRRNKRGRGRGGSAFRDPDREPAPGFDEHRSTVRGGRPRRATPRSTRGRPAGAEPKRRYRDTAEYDTRTYEGREAEMEDANQPVGLAPTLMGWPTTFAPGEHTSQSVASQPMASHPVEAPPVPVEASAAPVEASAAPVEPQVGSVQAPAGSVEAHVPAAEPHLPVQAPTVPFEASTMPSVEHAQPQSQAAPESQAMSHQPSQQRPLERASFVRKGDAPDPVPGASLGLQNMPTPPTPPTAEEPAKPKRQPLPPQQLPAHLVKPSYKSPRASLPALPEPQAQPQTQPQLQPQMQPQMQPQFQPQLQPQLQPQFQPQMQPQMQIAWPPRFPGMPMMLDPHEETKTIVNQLVEWGVTPEYLVGFGVSKQLVATVFDELGHKLPLHLSYLVPKKKPAEPAPGVEAPPDPVPSTEQPAPAPAPAPAPVEAKAAADGTATTAAEEPSGPVPMQEDVAPAPVVDPNAAAQAAEEARLAELAKAEQSKLELRQKRAGMVARVAPRAKVLRDELAVLFPTGQVWFPTPKLEEMEIGEEPPHVEGQVPVGDLDGEQIVPVASTPAVGTVDVTDPPPAPAGEPSVTANPPEAVLATPTPIEPPASTSEPSAPAPAAAEATQTAASLPEGTEPVSDVAKAVPAAPSVEQPISASEQADAPGDGSMGPEGVGVQAAPGDASTMEGLAGQEGEGGPQWAIDRAPVPDQDVVMAVAGEESAATAQVLPSSASLPSTASAPEDPEQTAPPATASTMPLSSASSTFKLYESPFSRYSGLRPGSQTTEAGAASSGRPPPHRVTDAQLKTWVATKRGVDGKKRICRSDLLGRCNDRDCKDVHFSAYSPTHDDIVGFMLSQFALDPSSPKAGLFKRSMDLSIPKAKRADGGVDLDLVLKDLKDLSAPASANAS